MTLHLRVPKYFCQPCRRYFRHSFDGIRPRYLASEAYRLEVFEAHDVGITQRKLSLTLGISPATVERWYQYHIGLKRWKLLNCPCPRELGIDEYYLRGLEGRDKVQVVVMDLSETYRSIAHRYFPNATIVADRFHVVRLINQHFLKVWQQHHPEGRKNRGLLSLMRRHQWHLSEEQQANLMDYLGDFPVLQALYVAKQELMRFMLLKTVKAKRAKAKLPRYLELLDQLLNSPLRALAKTLESWVEPIVAMWRFSKSNGITEGFHNKMEMMSRRAYGFRNFENYRLRVVVHCGWNGIIDRVRRMPIPR